MSNEAIPEAVLDALGDATRRRIVEQLRRGPVAVGELAARLPVGRPAVSKHLRVLEGAGLVSTAASAPATCTPWRRTVSSPCNSGSSRRGTPRWRGSPIGSRHGPPAHGRRAHGRNAPVAQLPPIRRQVVVPSSVEVAFDVFTEEIALWWPLEDHSVYGKGGDVAFRDGRLVERAADGDGEAVWGTVLDWQPPHRLRLTWHPGAGADRASEVEVRFAAITDDQTLVTLEHSGWERLPNPGDAREEYGRGWPAVIGSYARRAGAAVRPGDAGAGPVWLALVHTAGPALAPGTSPFAHPDFPEHIAFLRKLRERGVLLAAGSLDGPATGMT